MYSYLKSFKVEIPCYNQSVITKISYKKNTLTWYRSFTLNVLFRWYRH